jgi:hypothetical protein
MCYFGPNDRVYVGPQIVLWSFYIFTLWELILSLIVIKHTCICAYLSNRELYQSPISFYVLC